MGVWVKNNGLWVDGGGGAVDTFQLGAVRYSEAELDALPSSGTVYSSTASSHVGSTTYAFTNFGTSITSSATMQAFHEQAIKCRGGAFLWRADGNAARRTWAIGYLNNIKNITSFAAEFGQDNLELGWAISNFLPAAWVMGYSDATFDNFLANVCYPLMDFSGNGNWLALFAACRLMIDSYLERETEFLDSVNYLNQRLQICVYHPTYDAGFVKPIRGSSHTLRLWPTTVSQSPSSSATISQWYNAVTSSYAASYSGYTFEAGTDCEMVRDLGHEVMAMQSWCEACLCIDRCGMEIPQEIYDRVWANVEWLAQRALYYAQNNSLDPTTPAGTNFGVTGPTGIGSANWRYGWFTAKRLFRDDMPPTLSTLLAHSLINVPPTYSGQNHQGVERFSEGEAIL